MCAVLIAEENKRKAKKIIKNVGLAAFAHRGKGENDKDTEHG
jgi:hypothetical protein